jgi:hypothetical protein
MVTESRKVVVQIKENVGSQRCQITEVHCNEDADLMFAEACKIIDKCMPNR